MLSSLQLFAAKLALFTTVLAYLAVDLFLWHGPVWDIIHAPKDQQAEQAYLATVFGHGIDEARLKEYAQEFAFLAGQDSPDASRRISRVMDLVRAELIKVRTFYNDSNLPDKAQAAQEELARLQSHPQWADVLAQSQLNEEELLAFLQSRLKEQELLRRALSPHCEVSEEEIEAQYNQLLPELRIPESRSAQHLFISFQDRDEAEVQAAAQALFTRVQQGESLEQLAQSEGDAPFDLGLIYNDARQTLPELNLFGEKALPAHELTLCRSRWGWHLLLAGDIQAARTPSLQECEPSLRSAIQSAKGELALTAYLDASLKELFRTKQLKIYER